MGARLYSKRVTDMTLSTLSKYVYIFVPTVELVLVATCIKQPAPYCGHCGPKYPFYLQYYLLHLSNATIILVPEVVALDRFHCICKTYARMKNCQT